MLDISRSANKRRETKVTIVRSELRVKNISIGRKTLDLNIVFRQPRDQQVSHQRWIWGIARRQENKGSTLALKPRPHFSRTQKLVDRIFFFYNCDFVPFAAVNYTIFVQHMWCSVFPTTFHQAISQKLVWWKWRDLKLHVLNDTRPFSDISGTSF